MGMPQARVSEVERGVRRLTADELVRLAKVLKLSDAEWVEIRRKLAA